MKFIQNLSKSISQYYNGSNYISVSYFNYFKNDFNIQLGFNILTVKTIVLTVYILNPSSVKYFCFEIVKVK